MAEKQPLRIQLGQRDVRHASKFFLYPFFLFHMLMFGLSGFVMAYGSRTPVFFMYAHGGIAISVYVIFYLGVFGRDQVK